MTAEYADSIPPGMPGAGSADPGYRVIRLTQADAAEVAELHRSMIPTGFLSSLGARFFRHLYRAILSSRSAFGFGCRAPSGELLGFVTCTEDTSCVYKQSLRRYGVSLMLALLPRLWRPSFFRQAWETLCYPAEIGRKLPKAEVLSLAVSRRAQGHGLGRILMQIALVEFQRRGIPAIKVAVGADNIQANHFYEHCGLKLVLVRQHHRRKMNIRAIQLLPGCAGKN